MSSKVKLSVLSTNIILLFLVFIIPTMSLAKSGVDSEFPTFFIKATGGFSTYKSKLVNSNDTSIDIYYGFGVNAGMDRDISMILQQDTNTTTFALNSSSIATSWQETLLRYRWGPAYFGLAIGRCEIKATQDGAVLLDSLCSGYGGNVGFVFPISKMGMVYLDTLVISPSKTVELNQKTASIGQRMDIDFGASFDITKNLLDFIVGYKKRTYSISLDGTGYAEELSATYLGFSTSFDF